MIPNRSERAFSKSFNSIQEKLIFLAETSIKFELWKVQGMNLPCLPSLPCLFGSYIKI